MTEQNVSGDSIWASISVTTQPRQYEPIKVEAGARISVQDAHNPDAWSKLWETLEKQLASQVDEIGADTDGDDG